MARFNSVRIKFSFKDRTTAFWIGMDEFYGNDQSIRDAIKAKITHVESPKRTIFISSDGEALRSDWESVARDMDVALRQLRAQIDAELEQKNAGKRREQVNHNDPERALPAHP